MDKTTFVKLDRNFIDWQWFTDPGTVQLAIFFIIKANTEEKAFQGVQINRGEFASSIAKISEITGQTAKQVRTRIERLKDCGFLSVKRAQHFSLYKVENYEFYQERASKGQTEGQSKGKLEGTLRASKGQQYKNDNYIHNYQEEKELKNVEETRVRATPPTKEEVLRFLETDGQHVNIERFYGYYEKKGFPEDWQAKAKEWEAEEAAKGGPVLNKQKVEGAMARKFREGWKLSND